MKARKIKISTLLLILLMFFALILVSFVILLFGNLFSQGFEMEFIRPHHRMAEIVALVDINDLLIKIGLRAAGLALVFAVFFAYVISKMLSKDIVNSSKSAKQIVEGGFTPGASRIVELDSLNDSLVDINTRLQIKNQNRKSIYDFE